MDNKMSTLLSPTGSVTTTVSENERVTRAVLDTTQDLGDTFSAQVEGQALGTAGPDDFISPMNRLLRRLAENRTLTRVREEHQDNHLHLEFRERFLNNNPHGDSYAINPSYLDEVTHQRLSSLNLPPINVEEFDTLMERARAFDSLTNRVVRDASTALHSNPESTSTQYLRELSQAQRPTVLQIGQGANDLPVDTSAPSIIQSVANDLASNALHGDRTVNTFHYYVSHLIRTPEDLQPLEAFLGLFADASVAVRSHALYLFGSINHNYLHFFDVVEDNAYWLFTFGTLIGMTLRIMFFVRNVMRRYLSYQQNTVGLSQALGRLMVQQVTSIRNVLENARHLILPQADAGQFDNPLMVWARQTYEAALRRVRRAIMQAIRTFAIIAGAGASGVAVINFVRGDSRWIPDVVVPFLRSIFSDGSSGGGYGQVSVVLLDMIERRDIDFLTQMDDPIFIGQAIIQSAFTIVRLYYGF